jgi:site-specific DNA-cytosine methylase
LGRVANGIPGRVHRLKQLGNSIVPQVAARILHAIKEADALTMEASK